MKTVIEVQEVNVDRAGNHRRQMLLGLLGAKRFWDAMAAENSRITVALVGVIRRGEQVVQLVVTEVLKPLPHEA